MRIPVGDFKLEEDEVKAIEGVVRNGRISEGEKVFEFEKAFAGYIGTNHCVALNSGTSALMALLSVLKKNGESDADSGLKVITTPLTYIATSNAIVKSGFEPVYVDVDMKTFAITPKNIRKILKESDDVKEYSLILPVHLMGYPCDMNEINKIAREYNLKVIEDSSQAHGSRYNGNKTGSLCLAGTFSFYVAHNIQAGEMGAVTTDDEALSLNIRKIKAAGRVCDCPICTRSKGLCPREGDERDPRFTHDIIGFNFKTTEFQAALGLTQLMKADEITKKRRENIAYLNEALEEFEGMLQLPAYSPDVSYLAYPVVVRNQKISCTRLRRELEKRGVESRPLFGCIPTQQPAYTFMKEEYRGKLPVAEYLGENAFYVGCHQYLTQEQLDYMITCFKEIID